MRKYDDIRQAIKDMRKAAGVSQMKLAEKLDISYQQVQKYENGKSSLSVRRLKTIADIFSVPVESFFSSTFPIECKEDNILDPMLSREEAELIRLFRRLKDEKLREGVLGMVKNVINTHRAAV